MGKRLKRFLPVLLCLLLTGCGSSDLQMQQALDFRAQLLRAGGCSFHAAITADYGDTACQYELDCSYSQEAGVRFRLTAPETLRGLAGTVTAQGASVEFEGAILAMELLAQGNLAPMAAPGVLTGSWAEAYLSAVGQDGQQLRLTFLTGYGDRELTVDTWLGGSLLLPERAEIAYDGKTVLYTQITDFSWTGEHHGLTETDVG